MKKNLLDLSKKISKPITDFYEIVSKVAGTLNIPFFVVGATARDMILQYVHGYECKRGTVDIDLGIQVSKWNQYEELEKGLLDSEKFVRSKEAHRYIYEGSFPVDIVPFGPIGNANGDIAWPPDHGVKMSVLGFQEAYENAQPIQVRKRPSLTILFATSIGLTIMKLLSWADGLPQRKQKDAYDLAFILRVYGDLISDETVSEKHADLLEGNFDLYHAGARILGRNIAEIIQADTKLKVAGILENQTGNQHRYALIEDMLKSPSPFEDPFGEYLVLLTELKKGISEWPINGESPKPG